MKNTIAEIAKCWEIFFEEIESFSAMLPAQTVSLVLA
jgi:hypothetical protein